MPIIESFSASSITSANTIKGENINLRTSSASNINLNIESDYIECKASSGSSITIEGMALNMRLLLLAEVILTQRTYLLTK
jgi:uncharacterized membrane protein